MLGGKSGSGTISCTGAFSAAGNGTYFANISVAGNASTLTVSAGGNTSNCTGGYSCNGYGCTTPNGTYAMISQTASGVTYQKAQSLGILSYFTIYLSTTGWSGVKSGSPAAGGASLTGFYTN